MISVGKGCRSTYAPLGAASRLWRSRGIVGMDLRQGPPRPPTQRRFVLRPDAFADRLSAISLDDLQTQGVRGLIVDLDNTLVGYGLEEIVAADAAWIRQAKDRGLEVVMLSNNFTGRVARVSGELGIRAVPSALKPSPLGFWRALDMLGTAKADTVVIGDQLFTDVLGSRFAGLRVILTRPLVAHDWYGTRVLRFFERLIIGKR
jgi:HAD superfamily phosphatase (TIGR01668 family)